MINVKELDEHTFEISWDENDPVERQMNTWSEQDFIDAILKKCNEVLGDENVQ